MKSSVFVSSTLPFTIAGRAFLHNTLNPVLHTNGLVPLIPEMASGWRPQSPARSPANWSVRSADDAAAIHLSSRYIDMLRESRAVLALVDGPDVESGVAATIGYAVACGTPVIGWRSDVRRSGEPIARLVNVFVEQLIVHSGGLLTTNLDEAIRHLISVTSVEPW